MQVELFLFEQAYQREYDYYHLLSGADLPLKSNKEIQLEKNKGKEFIYYDENRLQNSSEIKRRTRLYPFLQNYRRRYNAKWKNEIFTFCERILLALQIVFRVNRVKKLDWTIKYGSIIMMKIYLHQVICDLLIGNEGKMEILIHFVTKI